MFNHQHNIQNASHIYPKRIIKPEAVAWLDRQFDDEEIYEALKLCGRAKDPGPDGFTSAFFLDNWVLVKEQVLFVVKNSFKHSKILKEVN